jgi:hypothetical protein
MRPEVAQSPGSRGLMSIGWVSLVINPEFPYAA